LAVPTLCLGEAIVDLICERPVEDFGDAEAFAPHFGGAAANVAVTMAREGAEVALAGGAGDDAWGRWLRRQLGEAGVSLEWFALLEGFATPVAFVVTDADGEPRFQVYGDGIAATVEAVAPRLEEAVGACDALFFGSNTLVGDAERELTMHARHRALEQGRPVVFDPNLRLHRWGGIAEAVGAVNAAVPGAFIVRANRDEAQLMTGRGAPEAAAETLVEAGARLAIVTRGPGGAVLRGEAEADVPGIPAQVVSTVGAGDALMGVILARAALTSFYPPAVAAALPDAVAEAARATERWGALA
jgi:sugar/nucleoside kinase (ribokinase family)